MSLRVGIIGGRGQMGQWFKRFFESQGMEVLIAGSSTVPSSVEVASQADVVVVSVPIHVTEETIRNIAPFIRPEALLMDLTSLKEEPMAAMLKYFPGEVVGTHPLFGPSKKSLQDAIMVLCPGRGERWLAWLKDLLLQAGANVQITTPKEHDDMMALVQGLAHFVLISLASTFRRLETKLHRLENFSTPTFQALYRQVQNLMSQNSALYACIQLRNQANAAVLAAFEEAVAELRQIIVNQDANALIQLLDVNRQFFTGVEIMAPTLDSLGTVPKN